MRFPWAGAVAGALFAGVVFGAVLQLIYFKGLEQGLVLFVTLPMFLGFMAAMLPMKMHPIGKALLLTTLCLVESFLVFREGVICVLMAAPLFYGFAIFGAIVFDLALHKSRGQRAFVLALPVLVLLFPAGPAPVRVATAQIFVAGVDTLEIERRLTWPRVEVNTKLPATLDLFPRPVEFHGSGLQIGDQRRLWIAEGEGEPGWFVAEVVERGPGRVVFDIDDRSHIGHWLDWQRDTIRWQEEEGGVRVWWSVQYQNRLAPDVYFGPAEHLAMRTALSHLLAMQTSPLEGI